MSRIGKMPIPVPAGVDVTIDGQTVTVKGPKGELTRTFLPSMTITREGDELIVSRPDDTRESKFAHGLTRSLLANMVEGVSTGFSKKLQLVGVGYRATASGQILELALGYSHAIFIKLPKEIKVEAKTERNKNPLIILESSDKQLLGQVCAKIRSLRKPEPYKGKGIKFVGEIIRRKSGKSANAK